MNNVLKFSIAALCLVIAFKVTLDSLEQLPFVCVELNDAITGQIDYTESVATESELDYGIATDGTRVKLFN